MVLADKIKFIDLCKIFEKIDKGPRESKLETLRKFYESCRKEVKNNSDDSLFPVIRLFLPQLDRERGAYGIKEATFETLYRTIFCLSKTNPDAQRLKNYKSPRTSRDSESNFAKVVYEVLKDRCPIPSTYSVADVNAKLDEMAEFYSLKNKEAKEEVLRAMAMTMSAFEQKWLVQIILQNVKLGLGQNAVLNELHPDAKELYDVSNSLSKVCATLKDPLVRLFEIEVSLFKPFRPMLADRVAMNKLETRMGHKPFYVETKIDGERMQIHKQGDTYMYFSRRGFDYTSDFGGNPQSGTLTPFIYDCFAENVESCILDGEMIVWDNVNKFIKSKGENTDVKKLRPGGKLQPCFYAFDVLLVNNEILTSRPLKERLEKLESVIRTKEGRMDLPYRTLVKSNEDVIALLNKAIDEREEGVVVKDPDSIYKPNTRKGGWVKVKPEYTDSLMENLDLLIVGGYYGQGRRHKLVSQFLLAVAVPSSESAGQSASQIPEQFYSLARVGSGYSQEELLSLLERLSPYWKRWNKNNPPQFIQCTKEKPDLWIEPSKSILVQVKASELVESDAYKAGLTLRFPRVECVREDKPWYQCMSLSEIRELRLRASGKLVARHYIENGEETSPKKRRREERGAAVAEQYLPADISDIKVSANVLENLELCVMALDRKQELERKIASAGGTFVQNPGANTNCVIADKPTIRIRNLISSGKFDIVRPSWLDRCLKESKLLPYRPDELLNASESTKSKLSAFYDQFGDSYIEPTDAAGVKYVLEKVKEQVNPRAFTALEIGDFEFDTFEGPPEYSIFRACCVYLDIWENLGDSSSGVSFTELEIVALDVRMYGGRVVNLLTDDVSHVICDSNDKDRIHKLKEINHKRLKKFHLVSSKWVQDSILQRRTLQENSYLR